MSEFGYKVPAKSWSQIDGETYALRNILGVIDEPYFPIIDVIERVLDSKLGLITMSIVTRQELPHAEAITPGTGTQIIIREDVYENACNHNGRARFTLAHELGHLFMHCDGIPVHALASGEQVPSYVNSEKQADYFAASLLMPNMFCLANDTPESVMHRHGVSKLSAQIRINYLRSKGQLNWA